MAIAVVTAALPAGAQDTSSNRLVDGDFESGVISLSLLPPAQFPLFFGGWAARGQRPPEIVADAFAGDRAMRLATRPGDSTHVVQDMPLNSSGFGLDIAFAIESGRQTIRLVTDWDRHDPWDGAAAFEATISVDGLAVTTPNGSWELNATLATGVWHRLGVVVDPRDGTQSVRLDGREVASLPGVAESRPTTLLLAAGAGDEGVFRYDAVAASSLVDTEIDALRVAAGALDPATSEPLLSRLDAAVAALQRGAPTLALPELAVVHNLLRSAVRGSNAELYGEASRSSLALLLRLQADAADLIELIEVDAEPATRTREQAQY